MVAEADESAIPFLQALHDGEVQVAAGRQVLIVKGDTGTDVVTGRTVAPLPPDLEAVVVNNRVRREIASAIAALKLVSPDLATRRMAARALEADAGEQMLALIGKAFERESDPELRGLLTLIRATAQLRSQDAATRLAAVQALATSTNPNTKTLLLGVLEKQDGTWAEPDADVRAEAERSLRAVQSRLSTGEHIGQVFSGISLGSILLLAALVLVERRKEAANMHWKSRFLAAFSLPLFLGYLWIGLHHKTEPNWTAPAVVSLAGLQTLRLTLGGTVTKDDRLINLDYLMFVPTSDSPTLIYPALPPTITT
jgi:hypothetical protein